MPGRGLGGACHADRRDPWRTPHADFQLPALRRLPARRSRQADQPSHQAAGPCRPLRHHAAARERAGLQCRQYRRACRLLRGRREGLQGSDSRRRGGVRATGQPAKAALPAAPGRHRQCLVDRRTAERCRYRRPRPSHHGHPSQGPRPVGEPHRAAGRRRRAVAGRAQAAAERGRDQGSAGQHRDALPAGWAQRHGALAGRPAPIAAEIGVEVVNPPVIPTKRETFVSKALATLGQRVQ